ncbi:MAG: LysR family transcriptional regulator [Proteobacteria bacterium]|nr:LysR family transcriptional regulator [Pseudomonadota bacterium]
MTKPEMPDSDDEKGRARLEAARIRLRIVFGVGGPLGPGKIDLLEAVARTGSISAAGRELGMSYRRSWLLIDGVNRMFTSPSVVASAGGAQGGGAHLTPFGTELIAAYRRVEAATRAAMLAEFASFAEELAEAPEAPANQD